MIYIYIICFIFNLIGMFSQPVNFVNFICLFGFVASVIGIVRCCMDMNKNNDDDDDHDYKPTKHDLYKEKDWKD